LIDITHPAAQQYAEHYTSPEDDLLVEVAEYTRQHHAKPHMLSGHLQGRWLSMMSGLLQPQRILEIGTFTGYSALCMAAGLDAHGFLHTIELRKEDAEVAKGYFNRSAYASKIILHIGEALEIIGELNETWDMVFIDADKVNYINYFNLVLPRVRPNGLILADNVLFHGQVLDQEIKGKNAKAIHAFNEFLKDRKDVEKVLLPLRDGIFVIRKLHQD
jgi:predicted O-methyltransferase YrrM